MIGIIKTGIENKTGHSIMLLYKSMLKPNFEYYVQFWLPHLKRMYLKKTRETKINQTPLMTNMKEQFKRWAKLRVSWMG